MKEVVMSETIQKSTGTDERQKQAGLWAAGIFTVLSIAFAGISMYAVFATQQGRFYLEDAVLMPSTVVTVVLSILSYFLIRRGRYQAGIELLFIAMMGLPVVAILLIDNFVAICILYIVVFASVMYNWVLPKASRRRAIFIVALAVFAMIGIEIWSPAFRGTSTFAAGILPIVIVLAAVVLGGFLVRQAWGGSLRNKLLTAFIGVTLLATGALSVFVFVTTSNNLRGNLERELAAVAENHAIQVGELLKTEINNLTILSLNEILQQAVKDQNQAYTGDAAAIQAEINARDAQWLAADAAKSNSDPLVHERLTNSAALDLIEYQTAFPDNVEVFITDLHGGLVGTTNRTSDYNQADEAWWQAAYNNGKGAIYISNPEFDESSGKLGILFALPVHDRDSHKIIGILRTTYIMTQLATILAQNVGETSAADIFISAQTGSYIHEGLLEPINPQVFEQLQTLAGQGMAEINYEGDLSVVSQARVKSQGVNLAIDNLGWVVVFHESRAEAFAPVNAQIQGIIIVVVIVIFLAILAAIFIAQVLVRPLTQLTNTAQEIAAGNINSQAQVTSKDEIGTLANAFNSMTSQLRNLIGGLEGRVAARTKDLATVAAISTQTSTIQDPFQMLSTAVHLTQRGFGLYHAHVFSYNKESNELQIVACGYKEGDEHEGTHGTAVIPVTQEQSLVARAGRTQKPVIVNDVRSDPGWLPNPLLPDTRAEMAVPMIVGDELLGVLDVQADHVDAFTDADANIQMTLASQIATSLKNAQSYSEAKAQADLESMVNAIGQKIQRATSVQDTLQTAIREVGLALGATRVSANIGTSHTDGFDESSRN
jgi:HAMP domain-containing protein